MAVAPLRRATTLFGNDILLLLALLLAAGLVGGPTRGLFPVYLEQNLAWTPPAIATVAALRLLAAAFSAPLGGTLAGVAGARRTLRLGLIGLPLAAIFFVTPFAPALVLLSLVVGLTDGLQSTGSQSYLIARVDRASIGRAASVFFVGSTLGGALGNLAAGALLRTWGFASLGPVSVVVGLLVLVVSVVLPAGEAQPPGQRIGFVGALAGYRPLLRLRRVQQLAILRFLSTCSWGITNLLWTLLIARTSADPATAALFGTVSLIVAVAAQLGTGRLIDAIGPGRLAVALASTVPVVAALSAPIILSGSTPALFAIGVVGTAVAWSLSGCSLPLIRAVAQPDEVGQVVGLLHLLWSLAMLIGTLLAGGLVVINPTLPFWTAALISFPAAIAAYFLWRSLAASRQHSAVSE